jgi:D-alanine-D-alanine ligase-like ATP-grasp enzyme
MAQTKRRKSESLILGPLLKKLAPRIGASVELEPEWRMVGQITFKNGKRSYFRYNTLDLNPVGASDVAKDKAFAAYFMNLMGYPVVPGRTFFSKDWCTAIRSSRNIDAGYRYAKKLGFPVVVKPNGGSQGSGVRFVYTKREYYTAMRIAFRYDKVALVQKPVVGRDYRVVVLDGKVISAYERQPLSVIGDGRRTISQLLKKKARAFLASRRDTTIKLGDSRIAAKLRRLHLTVNSVPAAGTQVFLLDNANLSTGGDSLDITDAIHPKFKLLAIQLTREMGLRLCGVDLIVPTEIRREPKDYWVLEINAAPGLDHYAKSGRQQLKMVESLYQKVLLSLAR